MRSIVGSVFAYTMSSGGFFEWFGIVVCLGLIFPFFHNGFFYKTRHEIDNTKYPLGFRDMSNTSIANVNFTFFIRTVMMCIGLLGLLLIKILGVMFIFWVVKHFYLSRNSGNKSFILENANHFFPKSFREAPK